MTEIGRLFESLNIRGVQLRNRIVMPPMVVNRGIDTPAAIAWYGEHARGGVGLVIVEATNVDGFTRQYDAASLRPLAEAIQAGGAASAIQLFPGTRGQRVAPVDLDRDQIETLIQDYAAATRLCVEAGFDGVEIHGAHGFLLNQFFSPVQNRRDDVYGVTLAGRMLLATQIVQAVRAALPADRVLLYRHTPVGAGYGLEESIQLGRALVDAGIDILDLSPSSIDAPGDHAAPFRPLGVPLIAVNDLDVPERAVKVLREKRADLVAVGRALIADAQWANRLRAGEPVLECIKCDQCHADLSGGQVVGCVQWPGEVA